MFNIIIHDLAFEELNKLPDVLRGRMFKLIEQLKIGQQLKMPKSKPLGNQLFELRVQEKNNIARCVYAYFSGDSIILVRVFIKKTQITPRKELEIALKRLKEFYDD